MKRLLIALAILLPLSCTSGGNALKSCLSPEELEVAQTISREVYINIYNAVAQEGVTEKNAVIERYFDNGLRLSSVLGNMATICPDFAYTNILFKIFDEEVLRRFVEYDPETCRCAIKKDGKYMDVLSRMSRRNGFLKGYYKFMQESDGCSGVPYIIAINYKNIDFNREDEQFIACLALLTRPDIEPVKFGK